MTDSKTATERLREMLDERGVKWWEASPRKTKWHSPVLGGSVAVSEWNGKMVLDAGYVNVTPEQAIAATQGSGECEFELNADMTAIRCDKCGYELPAGTNLDPTRYCGGCGKAVKR